MSRNATVPHGVGERGTGYGDRDRAGGQGLERRSGPGGGGAAGLRAGPLGPWGRRCAAVVVRLVALDERLHPHGIPLPVSVAADGVLAPGRFDQDIGEQQARLDLDRCDVGHVDRLLFAARSTAACTARRSTAMISTWVGKSRLPPLRRLARKTSPGANGRPLRQTRSASADEHDRHTGQRPPEPGRISPTARRC